jgi:hypothetical protein
VAAAADRRSKIPRMTKNTGTTDQRVIRVELK